MGREKIFAVVTIIDSKGGGRPTSTRPAIAVPLIFFSLLLFFHRSIYVRGGLSVRSNERFGLMFVYSSIVFFFCFVWEKKKDDLSSRVLKILYLLHSYSWTLSRSVFFSQLFLSSYDTHAARIRIQSSISRNSLSTRLSALSFASFPIAGWRFRRSFFFSRIQ